MHTETQPRLTRLVLDVPSDLLEQFEKQAAGKDVAQTILTRLYRCKNHNAERPLYFNDKQRNEFEEILGGWLFHNSEEVLKSMRSRYQFSLEGKPIKIDADLMSAVVRRAAELHEDPRDLLERAAVRGIRQEVWGE